MVTYAYYCQDNQKYIGQFHCHPVAWTASLRMLSLEIFAKNVGYHLLYCLFMLTATRNKELNIYLLYSSKYYLIYMLAIINSINLGQFPFNNSSILVLYSVMPVSDILQI